MVKLNGKAIRRSKRNVQVFDRVLVIMDNEFKFLLCLYENVIIWLNFLFFIYFYANISVNSLTVKSKLLPFSPTDKFNLLWIASSCSLCIFHAIMACCKGNTFASSIFQHIAEHYSVFFALANKFPERKKCSLIHGKFVIWQIISVIIMM